MALTAALLAGGCAEMPWADGGGRNAAAVPAAADSAPAVPPVAQVAAMEAAISETVIPPTGVLAYGPAPLQYGELRLPVGDGPFPVAVLIHGGCWSSGFATLRSMSALASALTRAGIATWNIEYRQLGDPDGGWPGTFQDWAAAMDHLRQLQLTHPLDLGRVVAVGHSAGGQASQWLAARPQLPRGSAIRGDNPLRPMSVVNIDGPVDLAAFIGPDAQVCGKPVVAPLMGGLPAAQPERYDQASPRALLPLRVPQFLVAASVLPPSAAEAFQQEAKARGDDVELLALPGTAHFGPLRPSDPAFEATRRLILEQAFVPAASSSTANYRCAAGKRLSVAYLNLRSGDSLAVLNWQGRQEVLRAGPTGSGVRYVAAADLPANAPGADLVWHTKGREGTLTQEPATGRSRALAQACKADR